MKSLVGKFAIALSLLSCTSVLAQTTGGSFGGSSWGSGGGGGSSSSSSSSSSSTSSSSSSSSSGDSSGIAVDPTSGTNGSASSSEATLDNVAPWARVQLVQNNPFDPNSFREDCTSSLILKIIGSRLQRFENIAGRRTVIRPSVQVQNLQPDSCGIHHCNGQSFGYSFTWYASPQNHGYGWVLPAFETASSMAVWEENQEVTYWRMRCSLATNSPGFGAGLVFRMVDRGAHPARTIDIMDNEVK